MSNHCTPFRSCVSLQRRFAITLLALAAALATSFAVPVAHAAGERKKPTAAKKSEPALSHVVYIPIPAPDPALEPFRRFLRWVDSFTLRVCDTDWYKNRT